MSVPVPYEKILMFLKYSITTSLDKCCLLHLVPRAYSTCKGQPVTRCFFIQRLLRWGCSCQAVTVLSCSHRKCSHDPGAAFLTLVRAHTGLTAKLGADTEETYSKGYYICSSYSYETELKTPLKNVQSMYLFIWELFQTDSAFSSLWD